MSGLKEAEHIVFDLDHTLWDFEMNSRIALSKIFHEMKLELYFANFDSFLNTYYRINDDVWEKYREGRISKEELRFIRFRETFKVHGHPNDALADELRESYVYNSPRQTNLIEGTKELLNYLKNRYELHILTNGFQEFQDQKLDNTGLRTFFQTITCSDEIGINKPNLEIFRHVEQKIGVQKQNLVMIGDNYHADILGAVNAGWKAIYFGKEDNHEHQVNDLLEIKKML